VTIYVMKTDLPQFDSDLSPENEINRKAASARRWRYDPESNAYLNEDGCEVADKFGQPLDWPWNDWQATRSRKRRTESCEPGLTGLLVEPCAEHAYLDGQPSGTRATSKRACRTAST